MHAALDSADDGNHGPLHAVEQVSARDGFMMHLIGIYPTARCVRSIADMTSDLQFDTVGSAIRVVLLLLAVTRSGWFSPAPAVIPVRLMVCSLASSSRVILFSRIW